MKAMIALLAAVAGLVACVAEHEDLTQAPETEVSRGTWTIGQTELANDCGSEGVLFPLGPAPVEIREDADRVTLISEGQPRSYVIDGNQWVRERSDSLGECDGSLREVWQVHRLTATRLSATYEAALELSEQCDLPMVHSCRVRYAVWGKLR